MSITIYFLKRMDGKYYKKGQSYHAHWVDDPQDATVWTSNGGPIASKGWVTKMAKRQHVEPPETEVVSVNLATYGEADGL